MKKLKAWRTDADPDVFYRMETLLLAAMWVVFLGIVIFCIVCIRDAIQMTANDIKVNSVATWGLVLIQVGLYMEYRHFCKCEDRARIRKEMLPEQDK